MKELITRQESQAMRGIAILAIVLHNYTHWLGPMVKENEYTFSEHNVHRLMMELAHPNWEIFAHLLSFFGHYGVPVFLFLSAYGLVKKYETSPSPSHFSLKDKSRGGKGEADATNKVGVWAFIWKHYKKLFLMMVVGYSAFVMVDYMTPGPRHYEFWNVVGELGMFSNLYADPDKVIWPGPYWYFGLMVQIYLVYRLILWHRIKWLDWALLILPLVAQVLFDPEGNALNWYRYNVFGALPVFVFGLMVTRATSPDPSHFSLTDKSRGGKGTLLQRVLDASPLLWRGWVWSIGVVLSTFLIMLLSMDYWSWMLVPFIICIGTWCLVKALPQCIINPLAWVGSISAAMFVCHPIARKVIIPISRQGDIYAGLLLYIVATIMLAMLFKKLIAGVQHN